MRQIFFDTETTGLDPKTGHRIVEIACVEVIDRRITGENYHCYLNPEREIDERATEIHNLTLDRLKDEPLFADIVDDFFQFIEGAELIAHNAPFDTAFLNSELARINRLPITNTHKVSDTLAMARARFPAGRCSLDDLCNRFEIDRTKRKYHGALVDSELLAQVYLAMTRGQESLSIGEHGLLQSMLERKTENRPELKKATCSAEDRQAHQLYMERLEKSMKKGELFWRTEI